MKNDELHGTISKYVFRNSNAMTSYTAGKAEGDGVHFFYPNDFTIDDLVDIAFTLRVKRRYDALSYRIGFVIGYLIAAKSSVNGVNIWMFVEIPSSTGKDNSMIYFRSFARVTISGVIARDPQLNVTGDGTPVTKFSIPVERYKGKDGSGERITETTWFNVTCWRKDAEMVEQYIRKGAAVTLIGDYMPRLYTDRDGVARISHDVDAREICQILGGPKVEESNGNYGDSDDAFLPDYPDDEPASTPAPVQKAVDRRQPQQQRTATTSRSK